MQIYKKENKETDKHTKKTPLKSPIKSKFRELCLSDMINNNKKDKESDSRSIITDLNDNFGDEESTSNSYEIILLKFKAAFKSLKFNHLRVSEK